MEKDNNKPSIAKELHDATKQLGDAIKNTFTNPIEFGTGENKKLVLSKIMIDGVIHEIDINKIIKLNEELTSENARLIEQIDFLKKNCDYWINSSKDYKNRVEIMKGRLSFETECYQNEQRINSNLRSELTSIKSKWWYKLMKWGW